MSVILFNHFFFISMSFLIGVLVVKRMVLFSMFVFLLMLLLPIILIVILFLSVLLGHYKN